MDRVYKSNVAATPPVAPSVFARGYPQSNPPTFPGPYWFHSVTEELVGVVEEAGLTPNPTSLTQLRDAILALIAAHAGGGGSGDVSTVDLASNTDAAKGSGMVGYAGQLSYATGTTGFELKRRAPVVTTIALLKALSKTAGIAQVFVTGYYAQGDGGGGLYYLDTADTTSAGNNGSVVLATDGGRWKLAATSGYTLEQFGAKGDNTHDDKPNIQAALDSGVTIFGTIGKAYKITSGLVFSVSNQVFDGRNCVFKCPGSFDVLSITNHGIKHKNYYVDCTGNTGWGLKIIGQLQQIVMEDIIFASGTDGIWTSDIYTSWFTRVQVLAMSGQPWRMTATIVGTPTNSLWFNECSLNGNTSTTADCLEISNAAGVYINNFSFQNNAAGSTDIHIWGTNNITVEHSYFEQFATGGTCIALGGMGPSLPARGVHIHDNYFQSNKRPVRNLGDADAKSCHIYNNTFQFVTLSGYAVVSDVSNWIPDCQANDGSQGDIDRTFLPSLLFAGSATGIAYTTVRTGRYQRIGNVIMGEFGIQLTTKGSSVGAATIAGLPMLSSVLSLLGDVKIELYNAMSGLSGGISGGIFGNTSVITLYTNSATDSVALNNANFSDSTVIYGSFRYEAVV